MKFKIINTLLITAGLQASAHAVSKPNVVIIYADDLGYGDLSCYGATQITTPNIDRLANGGVRFTNGYATASTCTPSRFSLLTGDMPFRQKGTGIAKGDARLIIDTKRQTLPSVMKNGGYRTACIGKWHLGLGDGEIDWNGHIKPGPNEIGFDYSFILPATNDRVPCLYMENGRVVDLDPADPLYVSYRGKVGNEPTVKEFPDAVKVKCRPGDHHNGTIHNSVGRIGYMSGGKAARWDDETMADVLAEKADMFIRNNKDNSFFIYLSTADIHAPRLFHPRFAGKSNLGPRGDMLLQLDDCVGKVMRTLDELQLTEKTLVIFSSDNGPKLEDAYLDGSAAAAQKVGFDPSGPLTGTKYSAFEGGTRVPFITSWKGTITPAVSDALVSQLDFMASLGNFVDSHFKLQKFSDSQDHMDSLLGRNSIGRQSIIGMGINRRRDGISYRKGDWKLIHANVTQLYNLKSDIGEKRNLAARYPERVDELKKELEQEIERYKLGEVE